MSDHSHSSFYTGVTILYMIVSLCVYLFGALVFSEAFYLLMSDFGGMIVDH